MEEFQAKTQLLLIKGNNSLNIVRGDKKILYENAFTRIKKKKNRKHH